MRRIKLVIVALALVMATFAAFAGPAMADNLNCRDAQGNLIRCDGRFFAPVNTFNTAFSPFFLSPFVGFNTFEGEDDFSNGCFNGCFNSCFNGCFNDGFGNNGVFQRF